VSIFYVDGEFVPREKAKIPIDDLAILRGYGVFDFCRTYDGKPIFLDEHIGRLESSARRIGLRFPWQPEELKSLVLETLSRNTHPESGLRIVVTGGSSPDFITPSGSPRLLILVTPLKKLPDEWYAQGTAIITIAARRNIPEAKSINYIPATIALGEARARGAIEAVYVSSDNLVLEGTTSNIFLFTDGTLVTPSQNILSGVTRKNILQLAKTLFRVETRNVDRAELLAADEVFISGSSKGIVPIVQIDEHVVGSGSPGPLTREMMQAFRDYTRGLAEQFGQDKSRA
jgi:branched-chain amino acid aminotransferase